ncbi:zinc finger protein 62-like [Pogonomyrmex barbatus]|uniref:Zinc finger protein 62-like n=1 Tax=Pogonomyrmex barbatus TaxID=144034 RepID=A0A8N1S4I3_9HYME|nr:zinc finger protein 62-like [Pogonomyrmex barbatus]
MLQNVVLNGNGHFLYGKESIPMQPWKVVDLEGCLYYAFLPVNQSSKATEEHESDQKQNDKILKTDVDNVESSFTIPSDNNITYTNVSNNFYAVKIERENTFEMEMGDDQSYNEEDKVYACDDCNICFPVMQMLKRHRDMVHEQDVKDVENITYRCNFCSYESTNKSTLNSHINRKHSGRKRIVKHKGKFKSVIKKEYSCDVCGFNCPSRRRLKEHLDRKHGSEYKYDCEYCGKKFKVKSDMRLHVRFKHKESPIICDVCGKTCSNSNSLYVHQKWAHFKPKYECEICKRRMVTQKNLDQHILLQHERRESFVCEECGKSFSENHRLKQHMMTHTGDRPHDCHICGRAFARRTAYRQHLLIHTGKRPYICDICGKAFTQKPGLICHRKSHPGVHPPLPVVHIDHILNDFMNKQ